MRATIIAGTALALLAVTGCSAAGARPAAEVDAPAVADSGWTGWWGTVVVQSVVPPAAAAGDPVAAQCQEVTVPSDVLFDENSALPRDKKALDRAVALTLREAERVPGPVLVEGFTDDQGAENIRLAMQRAQVLADASLAAGVEADRITVAGRGSADPVASNETASGRAQNRRVEIHIGDCPTR